MIRRQNLMTISEVAEIACVPEDFVRILVARNVLVAIQAGGALLFDANYAVRVIPLIGVSQSLIRNRYREAA